MLQVLARQLSAVHALLEPSVARVQAHATFVRKAVSALRAPLHASNVHWEATRHHSDPRLAQNVLQVNTVLRQKTALRALQGGMG